MDANPTLAAWLVAQRQPIEQSMRAAMGPAAPRASGGEAETLRRFRSFTSIALHQGQLRAPALDGLQINERRMAALLDAWLGAASALAGPDGADVRSALAPLVDHFRMALRQSTSGRSARGKPRAARRAVVAAIDRVADAFVAVDTVSGEIVDANPAAGALLGTARDTLLGVDFESFVPGEARDGWRGRLDSLAEGGDHERFGSWLCDVSGVQVGIEASLTAYPTRGRTLALVLCRPATPGHASPTRPAHEALGARTAGPAASEPIRNEARTGVAPGVPPSADDGNGPGEAPAASPVEAAASPVEAAASPVEVPGVSSGFARLSDGKAIPRRSASQLRRRPADAGRRTPRDGSRRHEPPPPGTPPPGSRS